MAKILLLKHKNVMGVGVAGEVCKVSAEDAKVLVDEGYARLLADDAPTTMNGVGKTRTMGAPVQK